MKKQLLLLVMMLLPMVISAYDIAVENDDGVTIYYNYIKDATELEVTYKSMNYTCYTGSVVIPKEVTYMDKTQKVTSIGNSAFRGCSGLTSVTIPSSVTTIEEEAFSYCERLPSIIIPSSVTSIGDYAFRGCQKLTSITIPHSVTSIGERVFSGHRILTSITVESGNPKYDSRDNCNAIVETESNTLIVGCQETTIPNSVTSIGDYAFGGCSGLTSVTIPNSVTSISGYAFYGCSGLTSVTIPNSVTSIGDNAFSYCI